MSLQSSWAFHNGKREMKNIIESQKAPKSGWKNGKYAERGKCNQNELVVKCYSNKKQCLSKIEKLITDGIYCEMSSTRPFIINKLEDDFDNYENIHEDDFDNYENIHEKDFDEDYENNRRDDSRNM